MYLNKLKYLTASNLAWTCLVSGLHSKRHSTYNRFQHASFSFSARSRDFIDDLNVCSPLGKIDHSSITCDIYCEAVASAAVYRRVYPYSQCHYDDVCTELAQAKSLFDSRCSLMLSMNFSSPCFKHPKNCWFIPNTFSNQGSLICPNICRMCQPIEIACCWRLGALDLLLRFSKKFLLAFGTAMVTQRKSLNLGTSPDITRLSATKLRIRALSALLQRKCPATSAMVKANLLANQFLKNLQKDNPLCVHCVWYNRTYGRHSMVQS